MVNHYENFYVIGLSKKANLIWKGWETIVSEVWKLRNMIVFQNGVVNDVEILVMAQLAWLWAKYRNKGLSSSYSDWYLFSMACLKIIK